MEPHTDDIDDNKNGRIWATIANIKSQTTTQTVNEGSVQYSSSDYYYYYC